MLPVIFAINAQNTNEYKKTAVMLKTILDASFFIDALKV